MENLINKILEIDKEADQKVKEAEIKKHEIIKKIEIKKLKLTEEINLKSKNKLESFEQSQKNEIADKVEEIKTKEKLILDKIESFYNKHHSDWVDNIVKNTISD